MKLYIQYPIYQDQIQKIQFSKVIFELRNSGEYINYTMKITKRYRNIRPKTAEKKPKLFI